jgi:hypothetical protein
MEGSFRGRESHVQSPGWRRHAGARSGTYYGTHYGQRHFHLPASDRRSNELDRSLEHALEGRGSQGLLQSCLCWHFCHDPARTARHAIQHTCCGAGVCRATSFGGTQQLSSAPGLFAAPQSFYCERWGGARAACSSDGVGGTSRAHDGRGGTRSAGSGDAAGALIPQMPRRANKAEAPCV